MIDVILPAYNNATTIDETIGSVVRQSVFDSVNLYIVDDGSSDRTFEHAQQWAHKFENIFVHRNTDNLGVMGNYRRLISFATQPYVAPIEGDDVWLSDTRLEKLAKFMDSTGGAACFSGYLIDEQSTASTRVCDLMLPPRHRRLSAFALLEGNPPASFSNCFYSREVLAAALSETEDAVGYDWLVNTLIADRYNGFEFYPEVLSCYRVTAKGAWSSLASEKKRELSVATLKSMRSLIGSRYSSTIDAYVSGFENRRNA